jgi:hypothetical protein
VLGYLVSNGSGFDNPRLNSGLVVAGRYDGHGFFLRKDNYLEKLPVFAAGKYTDNENNWKIKSMIMKSGDKKDEYLNDVKNHNLDQFLLKTLLWVVLTNQSHMRSVNGSDGRYYRNELCLDITNGDTVATNDLKNLKRSEVEQKLFDQWKVIFECAKKTKKYNQNLTYGVYQIAKELNTFEKDEETGKNIYHYPELNGHLITLKTLVKDYYLNEIVAVLFQYEFLK